MEKRVDLKLNICNFINDALAKSGKTNTELAKFLNVSETAIRGYRTHKIVPTYPLLPLIAEFFNVTIFEVLGLDTSTYLSPEDMELITLSATNEKFHEIVSKIKDNEELLNAIYTIVSAHK